MSANYVELIEQQEVAEPPPPSPPPPPPPPPTAVEPQPQVDEGVVAIALYECVILIVRDMEFHTHRLAMMRLKITNYLSTRETG